MSDKLSKHELFLIFSLNILHSRSFVLTIVVVIVVSVYVKYFMFVSLTSQNTYLVTRTKSLAPTIMGHVLGQFIGVKGHFDYQQLFTKLLQLILGCFESENCVIS